MVAGMKEETQRANDTTAESVEQLFRSHNRALVSFLAARLRSDQEAREGAQETRRLVRVLAAGKAVPGPETSGSI
jgi:DNA-directed RNA polymerase specialized sigma24 family protein